MIISVKNSASHVICEKPPNSLCNQYRVYRLLRCIVTTSIKKAPS